MDKKELQCKLSQPYNSENWKEVVKFVFPNVSIFATPRTIPVQEKDKEEVESFLHIGNVQLKDGKILDLFELHLKDKVNLLKNRVRLNDIVSSTVDMDRSHGVLSVFEKGTDDFRFTFSAKASQFDEEEGDFVIERTDTKRFTYLLGKNESCKTPAERFYTLSEQKQKADIKAVEDAFSVEKLSKKFFDDYKKQYELFVDYLTKKPGYYTAIFNNDDKKIRDFVKILLGRIVFIKFVQKKGWMGVSADEQGWENGDYRFLENAFENFEHKDNFYSEFLNPLFFEALDKGGRPNDVFELTGNKVPFLSGGLFDNHDPKTRRINFPKEYFESLFDFLDRYNFTIDENDVNDHEIGIDPEMLGHIFENLLEDNKDKGAFYTPKEIVRYMCRESLKEYLKTNLKEQKLWPNNEEKAQQLEEGLDAFVNKREAGGIIDFEGAIAQALKDVKICDPAIGSGAFPMGLLQEIFHLVHLLYSASFDKVGEIWEIDSWKPNVVKQNIIQNSIYGVDIEKGAVDIARLRFWLSLIVDEPEPTALPHLDYKIVVGNSLLSKFEDTVINIDWELEDPNAGLFGSKLTEERAEILKKISKKQNQVFDPDNDDEKLSHEIRDLKIDLLTKQLEVMIEKQNIPSEPKAIDYKNKPKSKFVEDQKRYLETVGWKKQIQKLKKLKANPEDALHFFDWRLDFPEIMIGNEGFDIVIGNPPYINLERNQAISDELEKLNYFTFSKRADIYCLFYERGVHLLKERGVLVYITSNKWMNSAYGSKTRNFLTTKANPIKIIDFKETLLFENATVFTNIISIRKEKYSRITQACSLLKNYNIKNSLENYFKENKIEIDNLSEDIWTISSKVFLEINSKIEKKSSSLKDLDVFISSGQKTGCNDAFILDTEKRNQLLEASRRNQNRIKPILRGRNIKEYGFQFDGDYLIISPYRMHQNLMEEFPTIYEHLNKYKDKLSKRGQVINGQHHWLELDNNPTLEALMNYEKPKIIWKEISSSSSFTLDENGYYLPNTAYFLLTKNIRFALGVLNSKISDFYFFQITPQIAGGSKRYTKQYVEKLRIPETTDDVLNKVEKLVQDILKDDSSDELKNDSKNEIDLILYKLYNLTYDEVLIIDPYFNQIMDKKNFDNYILKQDVNKSYS